MSQHQPDNPVDELLQASLRGLYAPPADPAYWAGLEQRVLARIQSRADAGIEWWQVVGGWGRAGAIAAGIAVLVAGAAVVQTRAAEARVAYEAVVETTPALPLTAVARTTGTATDGREATLRYVISH